MIRIGYVGVNTLLPSASKTFRIRNYTEIYMLEVAKSNILALENILHWNKKHDITLFRITSHLVPYASSPINSGIWKREFKNDFKRIGQFIKENKMRVSMHPGQYTVLNTPNELYFANTLSDLIYHNDVLDLLGTDSSDRIILHGGGAYGDKEKSISLLKNRFNDLPQNIRQRITLENDDRIFTAEDILSICMELKIPATFDLLHHSALPSMKKYDEVEIIKIFAKTWEEERQKIHYSNQDPDKRKGAHSETIDLKEFDNFYQKIKNFDLDIMLEVKNKQTSVLKLKNIYKEIH